MKYIVTGVDRIAAWLLTHFWPKDNGESRVSFYVRKFSILSALPFMCHLCFISFLRRQFLFSFFNDIYSPWIMDMFHHFKDTKMMGAWNTFSLGMICVRRCAEMVDIFYSAQERHCLNCFLKWLTLIGVPVLWGTKESTFEKFEVPHTL